MGNFTVYSLKHFLDELEEDFAEFREHYASDEFDDLPEKEFDEYEDKYVRAISLFKQEIDVRLDRTPADVMNTSSNSDRQMTTFLDRQREINETIGRIATGLPHMAETRLPPLKIPIFSGKWNEWSRFKNLFLNRVGENASLNNVEKLGHLMTLVAGEAASMIRHLPLNAESYMVAWDMLVTKYERPYKIANNLIREVVKAPCMRTKQDVGSLFESLTETLVALDIMGEYCKSRDPWIIYLMVGKFDKDTKEKWVQEIASENQPSLQSLIEFLAKKEEALDSMCYLESDRNTKITFSTQKSLKVSTVFAKQCFVCKSDHKIYDCDKFRKLSVKERTELARMKGRCLNCLGTGHYVNKCESNGKCSKCGRRHHSLLHYESTQKVVDNQPSKATNSENIDTGDPLVKVNLNANTSEVNILPTAVIDVLNDMNQFIKCRALLDSGSQASFITERCLKMLSLRRLKNEISFETMSSAETHISRGSADIVFRSRYDTSSIFTTTTFVVNRITSFLPSKQRSYESKGRLSSCFDLADPNFDIPADVDVLLGADLLFSILKPQKYYHKIDRLWIIESQLGWLVSGGFSGEISKARFNCNIVFPSNERLDRMVDQFWNLEEPKVALMDKDENMYSEKLFKDTTQRLSNGRYSVSLPFRENAGNLGDSYHFARNRFLSLERKFKANVHFKDEYCKLIRKFESNGFIERLFGDVSNDGERIFYLPHHGVGFMKSKLRIVFDASMKSSNGLSLNDVLVPGPNLQADLRSLLMEFRFRKYVLVTDIVQMYRQIFINYDSRNVQRFLWRYNSDSDILEYRIITVTDGLSCSPFLALRTMNQLAIDEGTNYPNAAENISKRYMDDFFIGSDSLTELMETRNQLIGLLRTACMELGRWCSNDVRLLKDLPEKVILPQNQKEIGIRETVKTLGIVWDFRDDSFTFKLDFEKPSNFTKRTLLADSSRIYDPMGWIVPITVGLKIIFQETCVKKLGWDDPLPDDLVSRWLAIRDQLHILKDVRILRWIVPHNGLELHGFCDASTRAYACVVYSRTHDSDGNVLVRLITARSRLAPIQPCSIARLELCAANLLAESLSSLLKQFQNFEPKLLCWTDSTTVLAWLASHPLKWKSFVANRCGNIHTLLPNVSWKYIKSCENPADVASRGIDPQNFLDHRVWWSGPSCIEFACTGSSEYPIIDTVLDIKDTQSKCFSVFNGEFWKDYMERYSSLEKMIRVLAYVFRVFERKSRKFDWIKLSCTEIERSFNLLVLNVQLIHYAKEIHDLKKTGRVNLKSKCSAIDPFLDEDNILRAGGRIRNAPLSYATKFPIVLPKSHFLESLIRYFHLKYYHADRKFLVGLLRQRFWISNIQHEVKKIVRACKNCQTFKAIPYRPKMGSIPSYRLESQKPFRTTGVDFAGPLTARAFKCRGRSSVKSYIAVFVCMVTKAVHLELVFGLDTESLINAIKRFVSRRGHCKRFLSDNGSNFISCKNRLRELRSKINDCLRDPHLKDYLLSELTEWETIPPGTPHMGGLWESCVKSVKTLLSKRFETITPTIEELTTALSEIEAILNSRSLFAVNNDDNDIELVTPSHLIQGFPTTMIPWSSNVDNVPDLIPSKRYMHLKKIIKDFWSEWAKYYYNDMRKVYKWKTGGREPRIGDVVLIRRIDSPPSRWPKGRIIQVYPGTDNIIRVVEVKLKNGTKREACRNLVPIVIEA